MYGERSLGSGMRILIVEDDPQVALFIEEALNAAGHQVTSFGHGGLALGAIIRGNFELLICDLMLPNMNGVDTIRMIRSQLPYMPVIVVSGAEGKEWEQKSYDAGATCYLQKPIRLSRLRQEVKLVEDSQVTLSVAMIDEDSKHGEQTGKQLRSAGCQVAVAPTLGGILEEHRNDPDISVLLVDSASDDAQDALAWANSRDIAAVAFGPSAPGFDQDQLMRWGASFCMIKPIDPVSLITQARFFVSPAPNP